MGGEGVERHIGNDPQIGQCVLERAYRPLRNSLRIVGLARVFGFFLRRGDREQRQRRDAQSMYFGRLAQQLIDAQTFDARHGGDRLALPLAIQHEHRIDKVIRGQCMLTHETPGKNIAAHAAHASSREFGL